MGKLHEKMIYSLESVFKTFFINCSSNFVHVWSPLFDFALTENQLTMFNRNYDWNLVTSVVQWQRVKWCLNCLNERNWKGELEKKKKSSSSSSRSVKTRSISSFWDMCGANQGRYIFFLFQSILVLSRFFFMFFFRVLLSHISGFLLHCLVFMLLVSRPLSLTPLGRSEKFISLSLIVILISLYFLASFIDLNYGDGSDEIWRDHGCVSFSIENSFEKWDSAFVCQKKKNESITMKSIKRQNKRCAFFMCIKIFCWW